MKRQSPSPPISRVARQPLTRAARACLIAVLAAATASCATRVVPVEKGRYVVAKQYAVNSPIRWSALKTDKREIWTIDGPPLQSLWFVKGIGDGESLLKPGKGKTLPKFRADMTESEIMEFIVDSLGALGNSHVQSKGLRPAKFGKAQGFQFDLDFLTRGGMEKQGRVLAAVLDKKLHVLMYEGAKIYYYQSHLKDAEQIFRSVEIL